MKKIILTISLLLTSTAAFGTSPIRVYLAPANFDCKARLSVQRGIEFFKTYNEEFSKDVLKRGDNRINL